MSATIIYPFDNPANYIFDTDEIEVTGGEAGLKLGDNTGQTFSEDFADDTGFTYDSDLAEFSGGQVQQKDTRPPNAIFYAKFNTNENGNWGEASLTGNLQNGAVVSGGGI